MRIVMPIAAFAAFASVAVIADELEEGGETNAAETEIVSVKKPQGQTKQFTLLPCCVKAAGEAEVLKPGNLTWVPAEEGRFYPLGSSFRTRAAGKLVLRFGPSNEASITGESSFTTRAAQLGVENRTIVVEYGQIDLSLAKNLPEGFFEVSFPGFVVKNPAGESRFNLKRLGDGYESTLRCVTGSLAVNGRHFSIASMQAADEFKLRSSHDDLETLIYGTSGDYVVKVDRGIATSTVVSDEGTTKEVSQPSFLDWRLSVDTRVQISRAVPSVGERMSVSVMAFDAAGNLKNHYAFSEGRSEVNTGELVRATKAESEELAKRAAEVADETVNEDVKSEDVSEQSENGAQNDNELTSEE